jgi:hypothetical protein
VRIIEVNEAGLLIANVRDYTDVIFFCAMRSVKPTQAMDESPDPSDSMKINLRSEFISGQMLIDCGPNFGFRAGFSGQYLLFNPS